MPIRKTRRARLPDMTTLDTSQRYELLTGKGFLGSMTNEEMVAAWSIHADELREEWAADNPPGTRCFCEWLLEIIPRFGERPTTRHWTAGHERHRAAWLTHGVLHLQCWPDMQQPEHVFLRHHQYISEAEYQAAKQLYDADHADDEAFLAEVDKRNAERERQRQERLGDGDKCLSVDTCDEAEAADDDNNPQMVVSF
jgi:hypothetical protein